MVRGRSTVGLLENLIAFLAQASRVNGADWATYAKTNLLPSSSVIEKEFGSGRQLIEILSDVAALYAPLEREFVWSRCPKNQTHGAGTFFIGTPAEYRNGICPQCAKHEAFLERAYPTLRTQFDPNPGGETDSDRGYVLGEVITARNIVTSQIEEEVRRFIVEAGYNVSPVKNAILCRHPQLEGRMIAITPDVVLEEHRLAIEVDPCSPISGYWFPTHLGKEVEDRQRNKLLKQVGWTVIRLRLGAPAGSQISKRDVVCESGSFIKASGVALLEAINDFIDKRPAQVRVIAKTKRATTGVPRVRRSSVVRIMPFRGTRDSDFFTWYPSFDSEESVYLRLVMNGRFLYTSSRPPLFIAEVGLDKVPRLQWREHLEQWLGDKDLNSLMAEGLFPWGESLLVGLIDDDSSLSMIKALSHASIDHWQVSFVTRCTDAASWNQTQILGHDGKAIVAIAPGAVATGYTFKSWERLEGPKGPFERVIIERALPFEMG